MSPDLPSGQEIMSVVFWRDNENKISARRGSNLAHYPSTMPTNRMSLNNISLLRSWRRRTGLTQDDVAFLIGVRVASQVSRHESGERVPELRAVFGYKVVFGAGAQELLPRLYLDVAQQVADRAQKLLTELAENGEGQRSACRADHLRRLIDRIEALQGVV